MQHEPLLSDRPVETRRLARRAGIVGLGTLTSRVLGAARDSMIAAYFPVAATDAFFVAQTIPNTLRQIFGEGAVSAAFVPVFSEVKERDGLDRARLFHRALAGVMLTILAVVTIAGIVFSPWITFAYVPGYARDPEKLSLAVTLTRIAFPYIFFMGAAAVGMGALHAMRKFAVPAFAPALLNVAMLTAPFLFVPLARFLGLDPVASLAIAMLVGGVLQVVAQWPALRSLGMLGRPLWGFSDPDVRRALRRLGPLVIGMSIYQANILLSRLFASFLPEGSQSFLYYGQRVVDIPQGVFALAIATATLPTLSAKVAQGAHEEVEKAFLYSVRTTLFVAIPATVAIVVFADPIVTILFSRGGFDAAHVRETARSLAWQGAGLWAVACVRVTVPMFHAYGDTRTPVACSAVNLLVFVAVALALMPAMQHAAIACAIGTASFAQLAMLILLIERRVHTRSNRPLHFKYLLPAASRTALASLAMGAVLYAFTRLGDWPRGGNDLRNIAVFIGGLATSGVVFTLVAYALGSEELRETWNAIRRRTA